MSQWGENCFLKSPWFYINSVISSENILSDMNLNCYVIRFVFSRCRKAIPVATSAYLENLPSHYTQNVHLNQVCCLFIYAVIVSFSTRWTLCEHFVFKSRLLYFQLSQALRVFSLHARGPAFEHYAAQFQDECNKVRRRVTFSSRLSLLSEQFIS